MWKFEEYAANTAVIDEYGTTLSYQELNAENSKLVEKIGKRCLVFCFCQNSIGSIMGYTAFINSNIPTVLLNAHLDEELRMFYWIIISRHIFGYLKSN